MRREGESGARQGLLLSSVNWLLDKANLRYRVYKVPLPQSLKKYPVYK